MHKQITIEQESRKVRFTLNTSILYVMNAELFQRRNVIKANEYRIMQIVFLILAVCGFRIYNREVISINIKNLGCSLFVRPKTIGILPIPMIIRIVWIDNESYLVRACRAFFVFSNFLKREAQSFCILSNQLQKRLGSIIGDLI